MRWPWVNRDRVRESKKKIEEQDRIANRIASQEQHIKELADFARGQLRQNHLTELFGQIPPRRHT